jgi:O-glycosyl hydrolase
MAIWACHGYGNDGATPDPGSGEATAWGFGRDRFWPTGKPFWMTETSGYSDSWSDSRQLAQSIYAALKFGRISGWVWWQLSENNGAGNPPSEYVLMNLGVPGKRYYISKHYYRYVRPEAVMVNSTSDNSSILVVAFKHPQQKTSTIVLINTAAEARTVELSINGDILPSQYNIYRTTASDNCVFAGTTPHNGSVAMPASSVITLYGTDLRSFCDHATDGVINLLDLAELGSRWQQVPTPPPYLDVAPAGGDGMVDVLDLAAMAEAWMQTIE